MNTYYIQSIVGRNRVAVEIEAFSLEDALEIFSQLDIPQTNDWIKINGKWVLID